MHAGNVLSPGRIYCFLRANHSRNILEYSRCHLHLKFDGDGGTFLPLHNMQAGGRTSVGGGGSAEGV